MKRFERMLAVAIALIMAAMMVTACGSSKKTDGGSASDGVDRTAESYELSAGDDFIVGFDAEYPPYGYMDDNGEYTGFDLELAEAVCEIYGWNLVKTPIDWDSKDAELASGAIDCIWNGFTINGRESDYTWSEPYVNNSQVVVVPKDSSIKSLTDLAGKTVGVQAASAGLDAAEAYADENGVAYGTLQQFADYNTAFTELMSGAIDALVIDIGVADYQIANRGEDNFVELDEAMSAEQYGIGFRLGNEALKDQVEAGLEQLVEDGTFAELAEKYELTDSVCLK